MAKKPLSREIEEYELRRGEARRVRHAVERTIRNEAMTRAGRFSDAARKGWATRRARQATAT